MFLLAKVTLKAFTTREMRIVSLIDEEDVTERILPSRALAKGGCVHSEPTRRAKRPSIRRSTTPFPDYNTEPVVAFQDYRCPSKLIC